jgi:integrase
MPKTKRAKKTKYPGVYVVDGTSPADGKPEPVYYIVYRKAGRLIEEKAGRGRTDDMTAARASALRADKIRGRELPNRDRREKERHEAKALKWTFSELWGAYLKDKPELKGVKFDRWRFATYIKPQFGDKEPKDLLPLDLDRLRLRTLKGKSPQTVKLTLALLKRLARFGVRKRFCLPISFEVELPRVDNIKTEDLNDEQLKRLLKVIEEDDHRYAGAVMKLALFTGMRASEILKLTWEDIDFERKFIRIRDPKGRKTETIPLNDGAREVLTILKNRDGSQFVFQGKNGDRRKDIHKETRRIADKAGLPKSFRPLHGLRHVYASMLASSGQVDLFTLQKLLTHKDPKMTQRYAHLRDEGLRRASNLAGSLVSGIVKSKKARAK